MKEFKTNYDSLFSEIKKLEISEKQKSEAKRIVLLKKYKNLFIQISEIWSHEKIYSINIRTRKQLKRKFQYQISERHPKWWLDFYG